MPRFGPIKRRDLIRYFRELDFEGPYAGGKHQFMVKGETTIRLPNPHQVDIGQEFLARILRQAGVDSETWEKLWGPVSSPDRTIHLEATVNAPVAEAWKAWTTPQGIKSFFAPDCKVDLRLGGAYEMYFNPDQPPGSAVDL